VASLTDPQIAVIVALGSALAIVAAILCFFRVSGGLFNPAITFALLLVGHAGIIEPPLPWFRGLLLIVAQFAGTVAATAITLSLVSDPLNIGEELQGQTTPIEGLFAEAIGSATIILVSLMVGLEKSRMTPLAPISIGLTFIATIMFCSASTGGFIISMWAVG